MTVALTSLGKIKEVEPNNQKRKSTGKAKSNCQWKTCRVTINFNEHCRHQTQEGNADLMLRRHKITSDQGELNKHAEKLASDYYQLIPPPPSMRYYIIIRTMTGLQVLETELDDEDSEQSEVKKESLEAQ
jgi:hypothetical protein